MLDSLGVLRHNIHIFKKKGKKMAVPNFQTVNNRAREYFYPDGSSARFENVISVAVSERGTHRLNLADGDKIIVAPKWNYIRLDMDEWSF
jgi:hypothetical protein